MQAAGLPLPGVMVCAEDVVCGKPHPGGYLQAARWLAVSPTRCLVFEDAEAGIQAGLASGALVINVGADAGVTDERCIYVSALDRLTVHSTSAVISFAVTDP